MSSIVRALLSQEDGKAEAGSRQADDNVQYEFKSVQALRGRESSAKAKWQNEGWEFVSENRRTLRTELNVRRVKPKTFGAHLFSIAATFQRMQPKTQLVLVASCALILVAGIIGVAVGTQSAGNTPKPSAAQTTASTAPSAEQTVTDITVDGLVVGPKQVVRAGDGCLAPDACVLAAMVVGEEPAVKGCGAFSG
jgi:hypothetical protein